MNEDHTETTANHIPSADSEGTHYKNLNVESYAQLDAEKDFDKRYDLNMGIPDETIEYWLEQPLAKPLFPEENLEINFRIMNYLEDTVPANLNGTAFNISNIGQASNELKDMIFTEGITLKEFLIKCADIQRKYSPKQVLKMECLDTSLGLLRDLYGPNHFGSRIAWVVNVKYGDSKRDFVPEIEKPTKAS